MALTVTLEFSEDELDYFRSLMHRVRDRNGQRPQHEVAAAAVAEVERLRATARSPFIRRRIDRVACLVAMLEDPEWQLPEPERGRVLDGLAYIANAEECGELAVREKARGLLLPTAIWARWSGA